MSAKIHPHLIPATRRIESMQANHEDAFIPAFSGGDPGKHIISQLAKLANPTYDMLADKERWNLIKQFLASVLKKPDITLEIPHDKSTINVEMDGKFLPIEALGTGIHQLVLLAAQAVILNDQVTCIEEPELHMHPELQRQFMNFIYNNTRNQYFITTHSAHIMDAVPCTIINVRIDEDGYSKTETIFDKQSRRDICHELGYKPSDLMQSNCLVWVEGPSDRIYIKHWLQELDPELIENFHFSFALYAGRVLSNFSAEEEADEKFIELLPPNRFPGIVMDSDKSEAGDSLNSTKQRILKELSGQFTWVTAGREIENYIEHSVREAVVKKVHKKAVSLAENGDPFKKPLNFVTADGEEVTDGFDKMAIAREVIKSRANLAVLDLAEKVGELSVYIRKANGMPPIE